MNRYKPLIASTVLLIILGVGHVALRQCGKEGGFSAGLAWICRPLSQTTVSAFDRVNNTVHKPEQARRFEDTFDASYTLEETGTMEESSHNGWWLNSGAYFTVAHGHGETLHGTLPVSSSWQKQYAAYNPDSTDGGVHPQNIFRLITREQWGDAEQEVYARIDAIRPSASGFRNESNGIVLFHRYLDSDNLYYLGIRVDGAVIIKKKVNGEYYTLGSADVFRAGKPPYHRTGNNNLIPLRTWIGIRTVAKTMGEDRVHLAAYLDLTGDGQWIPFLETTDTPERFDVPVIDKEGFAGIRTDFMDASFDQYRISSI